MTYYHRPEKSVHSDRGTAKIYDGTHSHIDPIDVRFADNGVVKYAVLSDKIQSNTLYLQGKMVEQLYEEWKLKLGSFGPSEKKEQEEALHDVKLTTKQLEAFTNFLATCPN